MKDKKKKELTNIKGKGKKKDTIFAKYVKDRIFKKNKNFFMIIVGSLGEGKSYSALRLCENLDESFTIDRCCFRAKEFIKKVDDLINSAEENKEEYRGKAIMWDELGVEHSAREFMTISNRAVNYFFQTCRSLNLILIMSVPYLSFIDSNTRKLAHCIAETQGINRKKKEVTLKIKFLQVAPFTGKEYPKYLRYTKNNRQFVLKKIKVPLPSPELREPYEIRKSEFNKGLRSRMIGLLDKAEQREIKKTKFLTEKQERFAKLLSKNNVEGACKILGISMKRGYDVKQECESKGVTFKPIWKDKSIIGHNIGGFKDN